MNLSINLKCDVCGSITQLKIQAGWLEKHPIRIVCKKCNISINGEILFDQINGAIKELKFKNVTQVNNDYNIDNYIKISGELLTTKMKKYDKNSFLESLIPTFFTSMWDMSEKNMNIFKGNIIKFLYDTKPNWYRYNRLFELLNNKNYVYLKEELNKLLPTRLYPADNMLEFNRALHNLIIVRFSLIYPNSVFVQNEIYKELFKLDKASLNDFIILLSKKNDMLSRCQNSIYTMLDRFVDIFQFLIPAYGIQFYKNKDIDYEEYGTTTTSFEDLKQFYLDCYETIGDIMMIPLGLNNLKYRNNLQENYILNGQKIYSYDELFAQFKGTRIQYLNPDEFFSKITNINFNNKLRNAIGHNNYTYDGINQKITYIPNEKKLDKIETIYLIQFANECLSLFKTILLLDELIYKLKIWECILNGDKPRITSKDFLEKPKRNEKCLCGSGKKYKLCCGEIF